MGKYVNKAHEMSTKDIESKPNEDRTILEALALTDPEPKVT